MTLPYRMGGSIYSMMKESIKNIINKTYDFYHILIINHHEMKNIARKKKLWLDINYTEQQEMEIQSIYGKKISHKWHKLYQSYTGRFNKEYFPEILFSTKLEPILCPRRICNVLQDKSLIEILYCSIPKLRLPKSVVLNCSGIFYDGNRNIINRDIAVSYVEHWSKSKNFVIKPICGTNSGIGVELCKSKDFINAEYINKLFSIYKNNFVIQECIINSAELRNLYDKSVNTLRIITYILMDQIFHAPIVIRMGRGGAEVDNVHAGGIFIGVDDDGLLHDKAFSEYGDVYEEHPDSKILFAGYRIPNIKSVIDIAYACHKRTPHTRCISWDFTFDENENVVLIEANMTGQAAWISQIANGESLFGRNTERMLEYIGITKKQSKKLVPAEKKSNF